MLCRCGKLFSHNYKAYYCSKLKVRIPLSKLISIVGSFPIVLVLSTFGTFILSWLITKSGPIRYFFGLPTKKDSILPGKSLNGTVPVLVMSIVFLCISITVNFV